MPDAVEIKEDLDRVRAAGSVAAAMVAGLLAIAGLLRFVIQVPIPGVVFLVGAALFASDLALARLPTPASERGLSRFNFLHHALDICGITLILRSIGAAGLGTSYLYLLVILHANMAYRRLGGMVATGVCALTFASLVLLEHWGFGPEVELFPQRQALLANPGFVAFTILGVGCGGLALFSFTFAAFADMLRAKQDQLRSANLELEAAVATRTADLSDALIQLRTAHAELQRRDKIKTDFLANVSHELRTPLTSIRSFAEILLHYPDEEATHRQEFLGIIAAEADRLSRLIEDVLDIARIESGNVRWNFSSVDLPSLLAFCVRTLGPLAQDQGLALRLELPSDLPSVRADRDRIAQVLHNLLGNAVKFAPHGEVAVGATRHGGEVRVYVRDRGPGIPAEERDRVFDKFQRVSDAKAGLPRGTGLGLPISAEIVAHHGGRIWVEDAPGGGCVFCFTLPVHQAPAPPHRAGPLVAARLEGEVSSRR